MAGQGGSITAFDTDVEGTGACVLNQGGSIRRCEEGVHAEDQHCIAGRLVGQPARASMDDRRVPEEEGPLRGGGHPFRPGKVGGGLRDEAGVGAGRLPFAVGARDKAGFRACQVGVQLYHQVVGVE